MTIAPQRILADPSPHPIHPPVPMRTRRCPIRAGLHCQGCTSSQPARTTPDSLLTCARPGDAIHPTSHCDVRGRSIQHVGD
jgi:hypothetical protein